MQPQSPREPPPTLALMHAVFVLAGFGTFLLGPILPLLATKWHLFDSQSGLLLLAQFIGATLGGVTVSSRFSRDLLQGLAAAAAGFATFAFAAGWSIRIYAFSQPYALALPALLLGGFGVGRIIASVNILAGARYTAHRGAALARLNFTWSFGALLSPLLAAVLHAVPLATRLAIFALLFAACALTLLLQLRRQPVEASATLDQTPATLAPVLFLYFAALLFVYGGLETSLSGWLTTYALRYGGSSLVLSQYTLVLLLCGLTAGRALSSWLLLHLREATLQRTGLLLAAILAAALTLAHRTGLIAALAVLLGTSLAPIFPSTFALLMAHRPPARTAGIVLAASGLGAAALPALIGLVSTRTDSLQRALILPVAAAAVMLLLSVFPPRAAATP